ncbi:hypothetical protein C8J56DRAFT_1053092 [Mycena floridula]|nr:hypothetical protein C8J56DRAFT_1053092 [Mycena floridula]
MAASNGGDMEKYLKAKKLSWGDAVAQGSKIELTGFLPSLASGLGIDYIPIFAQVLSAPNVIQAELYIKTYLAVINKAKGLSALTGKADVAVGIVAEPTIQLKNVGTLEEQTKLMLQVGGRK